MIFWLCNIVSRFQWTKAEAWHPIETEFSKSTAMFGRLANPNGDNNVLSQVLYGLALRFVDLILI